MTQEEGTLRSDGTTDRIGAQANGSPAAPHADGASAPGDGLSIATRVERTTAQADGLPAAPEADRTNPPADGLPVVSQAGWWRIASWCLLLLAVSAVAGVIAGMLQAYLEGPSEDGALTPGYYLPMMALTVFLNLTLVAAWIRHQGLSFARLRGMRLDSQSRLLSVLVGATLFMTQQVMVRQLLRMPPLHLELTRVHWGLLAVDLLLRGGLFPVVEEFFFRGLLMAALKGRGLGNTAVVLVSSFIFAASHIDNYRVPLYLVWFVIFGAVVAVARLRSRSLEACVLLHGAHNIGAILVLAAS